MVVVPRGGTRGGGATSMGVGAGASASGTRCAAGGRCAHSAGRRVQRASAVRKSWVRASATGWRRGAVVGRDRKSTRLNSSHGYISYAVFCLKKKKNEQTVHPRPANHETVAHAARAQYVTSL